MTIVVVQTCSENIIKPPLCVSFISFTISSHRRTGKYSFREGGGQPKLCQSIGPLIKTTKI